MDEREQRILERAILYASQMKTGINPLDNTPIQAGELLREEKIQRWLAYVEEILKKYRLANMERIPFVLTEEAARLYRPSAEPVTVSQLANRIRDFCLPENMMILRGMDINAWLVREGYLTEIPYHGKTARTVTAKGSAAGLLAAETLNRQNESYIRVTFTPAAQYLVLNSANQIAAIRAGKAEEI